MMMQHKRNAIVGQPIEIRPFAEFKQDKAIKLRRIRMNELAMAGKRIADENPELVGWYLIQVKPRHETAVENALKKEKVEALVLREEEEEVVRRGRLWIIPGKPWLPDFVLVRCVPTPAAFRGLLGVDHVVGVVGGWERPYRVPDRSINEFNELMLAQASDHDERNKAIKKGDKVKITLGPFMGFEAVVLVTGKGSKKRCKVQYKLHGNYGTVNIPLANLAAL